MRSNNRNTAVMIAFFAVILAMALTACGITSSPERTTEKFFSAVKSGDIDKSIECFTPVIQEQYKAALAVSNALFGIDTGALLGGVLGTINVDYYADYDFKVVGTSKTDDTHAVVTVDVYVDGSLDSTTTVSCLKIDGAWYIEE